MIYTMLRWPDVMSSLTSVFTESETIVITELNGLVVICLHSGNITLPYQNVARLFLSQPFALRGALSSLNNSRPYFVIDTKKNIVRLATEMEAQWFIDETTENETFDFTNVERHEAVISSMMAHWIESQMEYLPLDDDESVTVYPLSIAVV